MEKYKEFLTKKNVLALLGLVLVAVALPLATVLVKQSQETRKKAAACPIAARIAVNFLNSSNVSISSANTGDVVKAKLTLTGGGVDAMDVAALSNLAKMDLGNADGGAVDVPSAGIKRVLFTIKRGAPPASPVSSWTKTLTFTVLSTKANDTTQITFDPATMLALGGSGGGGTDCAPAKSLALNSAGPTNTPGPTVTPGGATGTPVPTATPIPGCNSSCQIDGDCPTGLVCSADNHCRNQSCILKTDCICLVPTNTPIPTATPTVPGPTATPTITPTPTPTSPWGANERCRIAVVGGPNQVIGNQIRLQLTQNPKFADNNACYYGSNPSNRMSIALSTGEAVCTPLGTYSSTARTQECTWNTAGKTAGTYNLQSLYGGHTDNCPNNACCDNSYTCSTQVVLAAAPTATPTGGACSRGALGNLDCSTDGRIDSSDLTILLQSWGSPVPTPVPGRRSADIAEPYGIVDAFDLTKLLQNWGI